MRVISPQTLLRRALATRFARRSDAGDRVPDEHPGDRRGQARPHPARPRDLAREEARRTRRPAAPRPAAASSTRAGPSRARATGAAGSSCSPGPPPSARARSPRTSRAPPRDPPLGLGDHPAAAAGRGRRRALLLRRRRRVRPARRRRRAARARDGAQQVPVRHPPAADRRGARGREHGAARDRSAGRAPGARSRAVGHARVPPAPELGRTRASAGRPGHRRRPRNGPADCAPRRSNWRRRTSSISAS